MKTLFAPALSALVVVIAGFAASSLHAAEPESKPSLGACVWNGLPEQVRRDFITAYRAGGPASTDKLEAVDGQITSQTAVCAGRNDIPKLWRIGLAGSPAIQAGALAKLEPSDIDRDRLLAAWKAAPASARDCTRANAAKVYGLKGPACTDPAAPLAFLPLVGIPDLKARRAEGLEVLFFLNALAQQEWAEALVANMPEPPSR